MTRRTSLSIALAVAAAMAVGGAGTARAQGAAAAPAASYRVDGFSPKAGRPGARVTITGAGFVRGSKVLVGGRVARVSSLSARAIVFVVPDLGAGADIVLRMPGVASDVAVGSFEVLVDPVIRGMSPVSGAPGTKVEITGRGFKTADTFTLGGKTLITESIQPERAVVTVPEGATTDRISLVRPNGEKAASRVRFKVTPTAPVIAGVRPPIGPPGTTVRLNGTGFTARDRLYYGNRSAAMPVLGRGAGWVDVMVPKRARQSQPITLVGPGGTARSPRPFQLDLPPVVSGFSPKLGPAGSQVEVTGDHFRDGDWVSLAGKRMPIIQLRERQISIKIPPGSLSGPIAIGRDGATVVARGSFEVLHRPNVVAFMPTRGEVGTRVTLSGQHLAGGKVFYGTRPLKVLETRGEGTLVVQVPAGARDEKLRVVTRGGEAETHRPFQVLVLAAVTDVRPRAVGGGGTLELHGRNLDRAGQFFIGQVPLEIESRESRRAIVRVPASARTAPLEWLSQGVRSRTGFPVTILAPARIAQFQPLAGPPGTKIIIRGENFHRTAEVFFGKVSLPILSRKPHELVAMVPKGIGGSEHLVVRSQGSRARSDQTFQVRVAPVIAEVVPARGAAGNQVLVRGKWFDDSTEI
ncbi:MAG TPA: IPT/TIG domain-containing protein, partial [Kofleriaceae bacterium]|nr:IPT/TIG domain-containing protein [Kofleriaceae bacterium]